MRSAPDSSRRYAAFGLEPTLETILPLICLALIVKAVISFLTLTYAGVAAAKVSVEKVALARVVASGLLDRHPKLKFVCPHLGGTLPYIIGRLEHQVTVLKRGPKNLQRQPLEHLDARRRDEESTSGSASRRSGASRSYY